MDRLRQRRVDSLWKQQTLIALPMIMHEIMPLVRRIAQTVHIPVEIGETQSYRPLRTALLLGRGRRRLLVLRFRTCQLLQLVDNVSSNAFAHHDIPVASVPEASAAL
jgi:hypothetical protein